MIHTQVILTLSLILIANLGAFAGSIGGYSKAKNSSELQITLLEQCEGIKHSNSHDPDNESLTVTFKTSLPYSLYTACNQASSLSPVTALINQPPIRAPPFLTV